MKRLVAGFAGLALTATPAIAQYPMMVPVYPPPSPYAYPQPAYPQGGYAQPGYGQPGYAPPVQPVAWAMPQPIAPVYYYVPQPVIQVVPVPVAKLHAAGALTRQGVYPMEGYNPALPTGKAPAQPTPAAAPAAAPVAPPATTVAAAKAAAVADAKPSAAKPLAPKAAPVPAPAPVAAAAEKSPSTIQPVSGLLPTIMPWLRQSPAAQPPAGQAPTSSVTTTSSIRQDLGPASR